MKQGRQIYFLVVITISIVVLSYTLLSASGYDINWSKWRLQQTGALSIETRPDGAKITITTEGAGTNLVTSGTAPKLVRDLLPGDYTLTVTLPEHTNWQGLATVQAQQTTFFQHIVLFRTAPLQNTVLGYPPPTDSSLQQGELSPRVQYTLSQLPLSVDFKIIAKTAATVIVFDPKREQVYLVSTIDDAPTRTLGRQVQQVDWNESTQQLLIVKPYELQIYQSSTDASWILTRQSLPITEAHWFPTGYYVVIAANTDVTAIETRITSTPNQVLLYQGVKPHGLVHSEDGATLYLTDNNKPYALTIL